MATTAEPPSQSLLQILPLPEPPAPIVDPRCVRRILRCNRCRIEKPTQSNELDSSKESDAAASDASINAAHNDEGDIDVHRNVDNSGDHSSDDDDDDGDSEGSGKSSKEYLPLNEENVRERLEAEGRERLNEIPLLLRSMRESLAGKRFEPAQLDALISNARERRSAHLRTILAAQATPEQREALSALGLADLLRIVTREPVGTDSWNEAHPSIRVDFGGVLAKATELGHLKMSDDVEISIFADSNGGDGGGDCSNVDNAKSGRQNSNNNDNDNGDRNGDDNGNGDGNDDGNVNGNTNGDGSTNGNRASGLERHGEYGADDSSDGDDDNDRKNDSKDDDDDEDDMEPWENRCLVRVNDNPMHGSEIGYYCHAKKCRCSSSTRYLDDESDTDFSTRTDKEDPRLDGMHPTHYGSLSDYPSSCGIPTPENHVGTGFYDNDEYWWCAAKRTSLAAIYGPNEDPPRSMMREARERRKARRDARHVAIQQKVRKIIEENPETPRGLAIAAAIRAMPDITDTDDDDDADGDDNSDCDNNGDKKTENADNPIGTKSGSDDDDAGNITNNINNNDNDNNHNNKPKGNKKRQRSTRREDVDPAPPSLDPNPLIAAGVWAMPHSYATRARVKAVAGLPPRDPFPVAGWIEGHDHHPTEPDSEAYHVWIAPRITELDRLLFELETDP